MSDRAWCPDCGRTREIVETDTTDSGDSRVRIEIYHVTHFDCGHSTTRTTDGGRSPLQQAGLPRAYTIPLDDPEPWDAPR